MLAYRIGDPGGRYPIYSPDGAARLEGRWHMRGQEVIYASEHYSTALLEKLVHWNGELPSNQHYIAITIPAGTAYEVITTEILPGWGDPAVAREAGARWYAEGRAAILIVPSLVAPIERNVVINTTHADARLIKPGLEQPVPWDERLFVKGRSKK